MNWIRLQSEYFRHRKTLRLIRRLGEVAALYPIRLWAWAVEQSIDGSLRDIDPEELAMICGFAGDAGTLWAAMVDCGFVEIEDGRASIRSWDEHQGKLIDRAERNRMRTRAARTRHEADTCPATDVTNVTNERNETDEQDETEEAPEFELYTPPLTPFGEAWEEFRKYRAERKLPLWKPVTCRKKLAECAKAGDEASIQAINEAIGNGWNSFFPLKVKARAPFMDRQAALVASLKDGSEAERVDGPSTSARLAALADSLPDTLADVARWRIDIRRLSGDPEAVEAKLAEMDRELIESLRKRLSLAVTSELAAKVATARERLASRISGFELDAAADRLWTQYIRAHYGVPVLSLFSEEAKAA